MPKPSTNKHARLQDRDYEILQHVLLYRMTTREVLHSLFFDLAEQNAVTKVTSRLCNDGFLARYPLAGPSSYYAIGKRGAKLFGVSIRKVKPMGPQSLYMHLACLGFCFAKPRQRRRLSVSEMQKSYPGLVYKKLDSCQYVIDSSEAAPRIVNLSIDCGSPAESIVRKTKGAIAEHAKQPLFAALIDKQRFVVACVTYHDDKKRVIEALFSKESLPFDIATETVPQLFEIQAIQNV